MKILSLTQNTPEWLQYRKWKVCASEISAILGSNPWKSAYKLFHEKVGEVKPFVTDAMRHGAAVESEARAKINEVLGANYKPICIEHDEMDFLFASLDGYDDQVEIPLIEIKCPVKIDSHHIALSDKVPGYYIAQLNLQMLIAGVESCYYCSYMPYDLIPLAIVLVKRDPELCKRIVEAAKAFYDRMLNMNCPEPEKKDIQPIVINDPALVEMALKRVKLKEQMVGLEQELDAIDEALKSACAESSVIGPVKVTKSEVKGSIQYDKIEALSGIDLEKYRKPSYTKWTVK